MRFGVKYFLAHPAYRNAWRCCGLPTRLRQAPWGAWRRKAESWKRDWSLSGFHFVPDFDVPGAARNILPEVDALHVGVGIVEVQTFLFRPGHELGRGGIGGGVMGGGGGF